MNRESLWQRLAGQPFWSLSWALAGACLWPWIIPEDWQGLNATQIGLLLCIGIVQTGLALRFKMAAHLCPLIFLSLYTLGWMHFQVRKPHPIPTGPQRIEGVICNVWRIQQDRALTQLRIRAPLNFQGETLSLRVFCKASDPLPPPGSPVQLQGEFRSIESGPAFLGERPLWRARNEGLPVRIYLKSFQDLNVLGPPGWNPLLSLRRLTHERFEALHLQGPARDIWGAITLGLQSADTQLFSIFAESGTLHTLIVSGLQITLAMVFLEALWARLFRRGSTWAALLGGLLYSSLVGFSAPVWRGLLMGSAWAMSRGIGWKSPGVINLHGALLLWFIAHPASGADPGFLLSWFAILGLVWTHEPIAHLFRPLLGEGVSKGMAHLIAPWLTTFPLLALFYGGAPLWGVLANALLLPLITLLTPMCLLLILFPIPAATALVAWTLDQCFQHLPLLARIQPIATGTLWPWFLLLLGWIALAQARAYFCKTRLLCMGLTALSITLLLTHGTGKKPKQLTLEIPDLGQGEALLLRVPDGDATLIDTGPSPWSARRLARILSRRGVKEPVHLILTHPHGDHAGGWATLTRLWSFESQTRPEIARFQEQWTDFAPKNHDLGERVLRGDRWHRGRAQFEVRWPPKALNLKDANLLSLVLRVRHDPTELWLMGDVMEVQEWDLLDLGDPGLPETRPAHVLLKAGHHGSKNASSEAWIRAVHPEVAIFTAGRRNAFHFPSQETLSRMDKEGITRRFVSGDSKGIQVLCKAEGFQVLHGDGSRDGAE